MILGVLGCLVNFSITLRFLLGQPLFPDLFVSYDYGLVEKLYIVTAYGDERCLNKRTELISKCHHQNKLLLKNAKDIMD